MIYTAATGVVRHPHQLPTEPCHDCGRPMRDLGHWNGAAGKRVFLYRCINRDCAQCAVDRAPVRVPSFSESGWL